MSTLSSYVKQALALVTGDDQTAQAIKNERKVTSYITSQISSLRSKRVDLEDKLETAEENLKNAKYSIKDGKVVPVPNAETYLYNLKEAKAAVEAVTESIEDVDSSIAVYEAELASF
jgi:hypothetical protein